MRRLIRFSLWHLLVAMLVVALVMGLILQPILARRGVIRRIDELGARYSAGPLVPKNRLDAVRYAIEKAFFGPPTIVRTLQARGCEVTDRDMKWIGRLDQLRQLDLSFTLVTDSCANELEKLTKLRLLKLDGTRVTGAIVDRLERMPQLIDVQMLNTLAEPTCGQSQSQRRIGLTISCSLASEQFRESCRRLMTHHADIWYTVQRTTASSDQQQVVLYAQIGRESKNLKEIFAALEIIQPDVLTITDQRFPLSAVDWLTDVKPSTLSVKDCRFAHFDWLPNNQQLKHIVVEDIAADEEKLATVLPDVPALIRLSGVSGQLVAGVEPLSATRDASCPSSNGRRNTKSRWI